ncbi:MFS transporter [Streptomyces incarnatus]|uniref:MFS transporter n=1 Tax=unclassified Streptomyces TaxID=2593676 RepID=UPI0011A80A82|nr:MULTISPECIES: MFS transporter [Streptomyces]QHC30272.1 DHA2 family efflux MFS transporter permease subunit [Streptomyces sp. HF10]WKE70838.1 MFS transporter [Streptomyces sp. WP-1]
MATTTPAGVRAHAKHGGGSSAGDAPMTHRQIMEALSGLLLGLFAAILSSTIVTNALPTIIKDLGGGQSAYTWVVTAALLAMTASVPLWGKLSDLMSKKALVQISLVIYVAGSVIAGLAQNPAMLITARVVQGLGAGGLSALVQVILAAMIAPRERGRYSGYTGATFAVATVGGPLLGGVITDTSWLGWRYCLFVGIPFALIALVVLQKTLHLPVTKRKVKVDWLGAFFITSAASLLLIWVTFANDKYDWLSWQTYVMVGGTILLALAFVLTETKASEPIIPLRLFRNRTISLASVASLFVGVGMYAGTVFFSQYFQLARDKSPTMSGVMTIPMIGGLFLSSMVSGRIISNTGRWKNWLVAGGLFLTAGLSLLSLMRYDTPYWQLSIYMALLGIGVGMMMQNLVLSTQNQVAPKDLGAASSTVSFFRSLGGAVGVGVLGSVMSDRISHYATNSIGELSPKARMAAAKAVGGGELPDMNSLPLPIRHWLESAYGHGIADVFLYAAPCALVAFVVVMFIKEVPLRTTGALTQAAQEKAGTVENTLESTVENTMRNVPGEPVQEKVPSLTAPAPVVGATEALATASASAAPMTAVATIAEPGSGGDGTPVHGFVRGAESAPVPGAAVTLISLAGRQLGRSVARADGSYALAAPGTGSYVLIASADGYQPQASTVVVGEEPLSYDLLLSGTSGLTGVVRASGSALPVKDAMVIVTDVRGDLLATAATGEQGEFGFTDLVPGPVTVAVNAGGFRPRALPVEVATTGITRLAVDLDAGARLQGVVRAPHGPLADARVTLVDQAGNVVGSATTGADGAYAFTDLDSGDYTVIATGYPPVATALTVTGTGADGHDIELAHPGE